MTRSGALPVGRRCSADIADPVETLRAEVQELRRRVTALEHPRAVRRRLRDEHDLQVFHALVSEIGVTRFSAVAAITHAHRTAPRLLSALAAADCDGSARSLGRLLARVENRAIDGLVLVRVGEGLWKIVPA